MQRSTRSGSLSDSPAYLTVRPLKALFFVSGAAGLIYEVVWTRLFADLLGSTALSMTVVFSVFLSALATGAWLFGRNSRSSGRKALRFYGCLEILIGLTGLIASFLLLSGRIWIVDLLPSSGSFLLRITLNLLISAVLIGFPTLLMGGTLPVILNAARGWIAPRRVVTQFYGWNTLGAACGTLASGFVLIWKLGLVLTLMTAVTLNLLVGLTALVLTRLRINLQVTPDLSLSATDVTPPQSTSVGLIWMRLAFLSGFGVLGYEILWGRMAKFFLGDRTIAVSVLLFVFITCLGAASLGSEPLMRRFTGRRPAKTTALVSSFLLLGSALHLVFVPLARSTIAGGGLNFIPAFPNEFVRRILITGLLISPPILFLGLVFPMLVWGARHINRVPGKVVWGISTS